MRRSGGTAAAAILVIALVGCSGPDLLDSAEDRRLRGAAESLIEVDLSPAIGLGPLTADCEGRDLTPGSTFDCSATPNNGTAGDQAIRFRAVVTEDGGAADVTSINLLLADQIQQIEASAAAVLAPRVDWPITADHVECADQTLIVGDDRTLRCVVVEPGSPEDPSDDLRYPASIVVEDFATLTITVTLER